MHKHLGVSNNDCHGLRGYATHENHCNSYCFAYENGGHKTNRDTHRVKCSLTPTHETKNKTNENDSTHKKPFYKIGQSFPLFYQ